MHLSILVPYRNRRDHLLRFVPHTKTYLDHFQRGGLIDGYTIHIIEQLGHEPFNRGKLLNCGVQIARAESNFVCLHDVDYLPVLADYTAVYQPTRLIWHGLTLKEDHATFFGAVVQLSVADFVKTNGYSNAYWGWGFEDVDLRFRCQRAGLTIGHRDGTFEALPHPHNGRQDGKPTEAAARNRSLCLDNIQNLSARMAEDGLSSLRFERVEEHALMDNTRLHRVSIGSPRSQHPPGDAPALR